MVDDVVDDDDDDDGGGGGGDDDCICQESGERKPDAADAETEPCVGAVANELFCPLFHFDCD